MASAPATASSSPGGQITAPLHVVTDDRVLAEERFTRRAAAVAEAGAGRVTLHLRGHGTSGRRLFEIAAALRPLVRQSGARLIVNERVDVALAAGADGVQLGGRSMPVADARALLGPGRVVGASVHAPPEVEALGARPDWLLVGTLYPTASHPGRPGAGPGLLRDLARYGVPMVGIGGLTPDRVPEVRAAGGAGVAVLRGIWDAPDPARAVTEYLERWHSSPT